MMDEQTQLPGQSTPLPSQFSDAANSSAWKLMSETERAVAYRLNMSPVDFVNARQSEAQSR
jgi:hypothetical protein